MNAQPTLVHTAGLVAGTVLMLGDPLRAADSDTMPAFDENYVKVSAAGLDVDGSKAAAQRGTQLPKVGAAGIEAFNYTRELARDTTVVTEGRALPGAENYLLKFTLAKNEVGSFEAGYKTFRTFYDGAGGFFPGNNAWLPLYPRALHVDRGEFHLAGAITLPNKPVFALRYTNATRDGRKDSTIWGDSDFTGVPIYSLAALNPVSADRKLLPAYLDLDERRQTIEATVRHTVGKTTALLSLVGTRIDNRDSRSVDRYVGELKPYPAIPSNPPTLVAPARANNPNQGFDANGLQQDAWTVMGKVETELSAKVTAFAGASYRASDGHIDASRLIALTLASSAGPLSGIGGFTSAGRPPYSYTMDGTVKMRIYTANAGLNLKPAKDLTLDVAIKAEDSDVIAHNVATYVNTFMAQATGTVAAPQLVVSPNASRVKEKVWSPELDVRYTGFKKLTLFGATDFRSSPADERTLSSSVGPGPAGSSVVVAAASSKEQNEKSNYLNAKLGFVWSPSLLLNLRAEGFTKDHENRFAGYGTDAGALYILDYNIYGARVTATCRPLATWTFTTRYVLQRGQAAVTTDFTPTGDSRNARRHSISETVTWAPSRVFYVQGAATLVYDTIATAYPKADGAARDVLRNADNNYWNGNLIAGFVVDKLTDAQFEGTYYKADNDQPALAAGTMPYGASGREYTLSFGVTRKLSDRWLATAKVGYMDNRNDTAGGNADFRGSLGYLSMQRAF